MMLIASLSSTRSCASRCIGNELKFICPLKIISIFSFLSNPANYGSMNYAPVEIITRGAYAFHIQQYLKWFDRDQMLIINSNDLKYDPVEVLRVTQEFIGVPIAVDAKNFVVDEETGHFCILGMWLQSSDRSEYMTNCSRHV